MTIQCPLRLRVARAAIALCVLAAVPIAATAAVSAAATRQGETLSSLLAKHLRAAIKSGHIDDSDSESVYTLSAGGLNGTLTEYDSPPHRFRVDFNLGPVAYSIADDGTHGWEQDSTGNIRTLGTAERAENQAEQEFSLETYNPRDRHNHVQVSLRPDRDPNTGDYIIDVTPQGASLQSLYLSPKTYLVDKVVTHKSGLTGTVLMSDYRDIDGVMVPAKMDVGAAGIPVDVLASLQSAKQNVTLNSALFRMPPKVRDYQFGNDPTKTFAVIPFTYENNEIVLPVTVNGKATQFILDSGAGSSFITGDAARDVGLSTEGSFGAVGYGGSAKTGVAEKTDVTVGNVVTIKGLPLYVVRDEGVAHMLSDRAGVSGALGYDLFARFTVTIDFKNQQLILTAPGSTSAPVSAGVPPIRLPIRLMLHTPTILASIDSKSQGQFMVDTGDNGAVHLFNIYAAANGLNATARSPGAKMLPGVGVGGVVTEIITPNHSITVNGHTIRPITVATVSGKGFNGVTDMAGGIGNQVLSKYAVTMDYDAGFITLTPAGSQKPQPVTVPQTPVDLQAPASAPPVQRQAPTPVQPQAPTPASPAQPQAPTPVAPVQPQAPAPTLPVGLTHTPAAPAGLPESTRLAILTFVEMTSARRVLRGETAPAGLTIDALMARHLEAIGGRSALEAIRTTRVESLVTAGGDTGTILSIYEYPGKEFEEDKIGMMDVRQGFDGTSAWQVDSNGNQRELGGDELADLENQIFFDTNSYVLGSPFHGRLTLGPERQTGTGDYEVHIVPDKGKPCTIFINPSSFLIDEEQHKNDDVTTTTYFSHYLRVEGVAYPGIQLQTNGNSHYDLKVSVQKIENNVAVEDKLFSPPALAANAGFVKPGTTSASIPFNFDDGEIAFSGAINGRPVRLLFDSGASTLALSQDEANSLHLKQGGYLEARGYGGSVDLHPVQIDDFTIGNAVRLTHLTASAIPFTDGIGDLPHGQIDGFVGYDVLTHFVVKIDYANRMLTFIDPKTFVPAPEDGTPVKTTIDDDTATVMASIDGNPPATFLIDTGDVARLRIYGPYANAHGFPRRYPHGIMSSGGGIGGPSDSREVKVGSFNIGPYSLTGVPTELSLDSKGGVSVLEAGSIGSGLLSRFVVTFDFPQNEIFFSATSGTAMPFETRVLGLLLGQSQANVPQIVVQGIEKESPANNSGLKVGDQITAVDGAPVTGMTMDRVLDMLRPRPGRNAVVLSVKEPTGQVRNVQAKYFDPLA